MPNIPCVVEPGISYAGGDTRRQRIWNKVEVDSQQFWDRLAVEEKYLDAVTGLAVVDRRTSFSLSSRWLTAGSGRPVPERWRQTALQTVYGSARMRLESAKHLGELRDRSYLTGWHNDCGLYAFVNSAGFRGALWMRCERDSTVAGFRQGSLAKSRLC